MHKFRNRLQGIAAQSSPVPFGTKSINLVISFSCVSEFPPKLKLRYSFKLSPVFSNHIAFFSLFVARLESRAAKPQHFWVQWLPRLRIRTDISGT
jgi:hypothetical protein